MLGGHLGSLLYGDASVKLNDHEYSVHSDNTPMKYTAIFHGCKNDNFQMKNCDMFLILAQNIDRWYTLEPPH